MVKMVNFKLLHNKKREKLSDTEKRFYTANSSTTPDTRARPILSHQSLPLPLSLHHVALSKLELRTDTQVWSWGWSALHCIYIGVLLGHRWAQVLFSSGIDLVGCWGDEYTCNRFCGCHACAIGTHLPHLQLFAWGGSLAVAKAGKAKELLPTGTALS